MQYYAIEEKSIYTRFRTGALAGLDYEERRERQRENHRRFLHVPLFRRPSLTQCPPYDFKPLCKAHPTDCLSDCLAGCTVEELKNMAKRAGVELTNNLRKAELVTFMERELPKQERAFRELLPLLDTAAALLVKRLLKGEVIPQDNSQAYDESLHPFPFVFMCRTESEPHWSMPQELRQAFSEVDVTSAIQECFVHNEVSRLIFNYVTLGGLALISEVFDAYRSLPQAPACNEDQFMDIVKMLAAQGNSPFHLWEHEGQMYVARGNTPSYPYGAYQPPYAVSQYGTSTHRSSSDEPESCEVLAEQHRHVMARAGTDALLHMEVGDFIYGLPHVRALTSYFDAHIPDYESEYSYADRMVDQIIEDFMIKHQSPSAELKQLTKQGWFLSEGTNSAPQLTLLVMRAYQELPRWELNGWSESEFVDMQGIPTLISESQLDVEDLDLAS